MNMTKRQRSVSRICSLNEELEYLRSYLPEEELYLAEPVEAYDLQTYWSQSKLDQLETKLKKALVRAKAARYDVIAPHYEQLLLDIDPAQEPPDPDRGVLEDDVCECPF